jgi:hypothetical protein
VGIKDRLARLEGGRRGTCSCGFSVGVNGQLVRARLHGEIVSEEEWMEYIASNNPDGTCHLCGRQRPQTITVGGPDHAGRGHKSIQLREEN